MESKIGTDRSIQSLDVMYPLSHTEDSLTFTDLRGRIDDDNSVEVNLGLAHRFLTSEPLRLHGLGSVEEAVIGVYGFADRLESEFDNTFYQATVGFEYFTENYSLRVNGYFPEDEREPTRTFKEFKQSGTQIFFEERRNTERPLPGYDVELGRTVRFDGWQLYGRGSYFNFNHPDAPEVAGSRFRTGVQLDGSLLHGGFPGGSQLTIGAEWQSDDVRGDQTFGVVRMRVPFGAIENQKLKTEEDNSELRSWQKDRLTERIERDVDIVTAASGSRRIDTQPAVLAATGDTIGSLAVAEAGASGSGAIGDPTNLKSALDAAGTDGAVLVSDAGGTYSVGTLLVREGQVVAGGHRGITLSPLDGSVSRTLTVGSDTPIIEGTSGGATLQLDTGASGQRVRNLKITGQGTAIKSDQNNNVDLRNLTLTPNGDGVAIEDGNGNITLSSITVTSANNGIEILSTSGVSLENIHLMDMDQRGVIIQSSSDSVTVRNIDVTQTNNDGILIESSSDIGITNYQGQTIGGVGIRVFAANSIEVTNFDISDVTGQGLELRGNSGNLSDYDFSGSVRNLGGNYALKIRNWNNLSGLTGRIEHDGSGTACLIGAFPGTFSSTNLDLVNTSTNSTLTLPGDSGSCD